VDMKRMTRKKLRTEEEKRHKGSLTQKVHRRPSKRSTSIADQQRPHSRGAKSRLEQDVLGDLEPVRTRQREDLQRAQGVDVIKSPM
jgi:hypothetical protein